MLSAQNTKIFIPAYNEEITLETTINHIRKYLPDYKICVFNNASNDNTEEIAKIIADEYYYVREKGKGNVFKYMIKNINSEYIIMTDADNTYDFSNSSSFIKRFNLKNLDTLIGKRLYSNEIKINKVRFLSNRIFNILFNFLFKSRFEDICSGFRIINIKKIIDHKFISKNFEIETELNVLIAKKNHIYEEVDINYTERSNSKSKLISFIDGPKIISFLIKKYFIR